MVTPILTIVTVTMNCANTIERTLRSVQAVKDSTIEYIIVDGVSVDGTLDVIKRYSSIVDSISSERDTGIYNAMNKGAAKASGRYILFINGDDEILPKDFSSVLKSMREKTADIFCATTIVGDVDCPTETLIGVPWQLPFINSIPHPSSFVSADLMRRYPFREDLRIASDYDFFLRAFVERRQFCILPQATALHSRGGASGDVQMSHLEISRVKRERLGWFYPITKIIHEAYRALRLIFR